MAALDTDQSHPESGQEYMDLTRAPALLQCLDDDRKQEQRLFTDFIVHVGPQDFHTHKVVLASLSDYFSSLFKFSGTEANTREMTLQGIVQPKDFEAVLNYAYTGCVRLTRENVEGILVTANYLNISYLTQECQSFMVLDIDDDNACHILTLATIYYSLKDLRQTALAYIKNHLRKVADTTGFVELDVAVVMEILEADDLVVSVPDDVTEAEGREEVVLKAATRYIMNILNRDPQTAERLLKTVRLPHMKQQKARGIIETSGLPIENKVIKRFLALDSKLGKRRNIPRRIVDSIPQSWYRHRKLTRYRKFAYSPSNDFEIRDPHLKIYRIDIWLRPPVQDPSVFSTSIGGICVRYKKPSIDGSCVETDDHLTFTEGSFLSHWQHCPVDLEEGEDITEVTIWEGHEIHGRTPYALSFETSEDRQIGPFGDTVSSKRTEYAPSGNKCYLYAIQCESHLAGGTTLIKNLGFQWIAF